MTDTATPYVAATPEVAWDQPVPPLRAYTDQAVVERQLDASFRQYHLAPCATCGRMTEARQDGCCHPCAVGNAPPLHGYQPVPGAALRAVEAVWLPELRDLQATMDAPCAECAVLRVQGEALKAENSDLARQVVALRGHCEELAAQVRAGKGDPSA